MHSYRFVGRVWSRIWIEEVCLSDYVYYHSIYKISHVFIICYMIVIVYFANL